MGKWLIVVIVGSLAAWVTAIVQWFQHDDHAALGLLGLSMVLGNYAHSLARTWVSKRRGVL
jgi:hypothetical protein